MQADPRRGLLFALASTGGIAGFVVPWKVASEYGASHVNALILLVAAALFNTALGAAQQQALPRFGGFDLRFAALLALLTLAGNLASAAAIAVLSPAVLTVVQRSEVILVALLAWPLIGERVDGRFWIGAAIAGAGLVVLQDPLAAPVGEGRWGAAGMGWAAFSAFCFSSMAVFTRKYVQRIDVVSVNALRLWMSVALWFVVNGVPDELLNAAPEQVLYASLAGFFGPFLGRLAMMNAARHLEARFIALATLAAPPVTLLLAFVLLGDLPSAREITGGAIMLVGIALPLGLRALSGGAAGRDRED